MRKQLVRCISQALTAALIGLIRGYQYCISPLLGARCRFEPSCSHYARDAIRQRGVAMGIFLTFKRVMRCHPFSSGGYDPVPKIEKDNRND